jgi:hypothetical protein
VRWSGPRNIVGRVSRGKTVVAWSLNANVSSHMAIPTPPTKLHVYRAIDDVLTGHWEPMGVFVLGHRLDEYAAYLPKIYAVAMTESRTDIANLLGWVAQDKLKLGPNVAHDLAIADMILEAKRSAEAGDK